MHLVETYATNCGAQIDKPFLLEKYFPMECEKYITFHPMSKQAKNYSYWQTVIDLILPHLEERGIEIVQIGGRQESQFGGCIGLSGSTTTGQVAYIIRESLLHLGCDSFPVHIASSYGKKIVALYPQTHIENVKPYWSEPEDCSLLIGKHKDHKPNFALEESPKTIDSIGPELVAKEVCRHLNIEFDFPYKTVYVGSNFHRRTIENVPDQIVDPRDFGVNSIIMRMDLNFNEEMLEAQLRRSRCSIISDRPITKRLIEMHKANIAQFIYIIKEQDDPKFAEFLETCAINYDLVSDLPQEKINDKRINYMDLENAAIIKSIRYKAEDLEDIKNEDIKKLYYMSSRALLSRRATFSSEADLEAGDVSKNFSHVKKVKDTPLFWESIDKFLILKKVD